MGLLSAFITVDRLDDVFLRFFEHHISLEELDRLFDITLKEYRSSRTFLLFAKLCTIKIVQLYKQFLNEKKKTGILKNNSYVAEFYRTNFEDPLRACVIEFDAGKDSQVLQMLKITKPGDIIFGTYVVMYAISQGILGNQSADYLKKQGSELNDQIMNILYNVSKQDKHTPYDYYVSKDETIKESVENNAEYHFENLYEYLLFLGIKYSHNEKDYQYSWKNGDLYLKTYKEAYNEADRKNYSKAESLLYKCLELNPIGIAARFELAEVNIMKKDYRKAKTELNNVADYLSKKDLVAKYYRRRGYIATEEKQYDLAYACFSYSLNFEDSDIAKKEIVYIANESRSISGKNDPVSVFRKSDVKIFRIDMKEWNDDLLIKDKSKAATISLEQAADVYRLVLSNQLKSTSEKNPNLNAVKVEEAVTEPEKARIVDSAPINKHEDEETEESIVSNTIPVSDLPDNDDTIINKHRVEDIKELLVNKGIDLPESDYLLYGNMFEIIARFIDNKVNNIVMVDAYDRLSDALLDKTKTQKDSGLTKKKTEGATKTMCDLGILDELEEHEKRFFAFCVWHSLFSSIKTDDGIPRRGLVDFYSFDHIMNLYEEFATNKNDRKKDVKKGDIFDPIKTDNNQVEATADGLVPKDKKIMYCRFCGAKLFDDSIFCHQCGKKQ